MFLSKVNFRRLDPLKTVHVPVDVCVPLLFDPVKIGVVASSIFVKAGLPCVLQTILTCVRVNGPPVVLEMVQVNTPLDDVGPVTVNLPVVQIFDGTVTEGSGAVAFTGDPPFAATAAVMVLVIVFDVVTKFWQNMLPPGLRVGRPPQAKVPRLPMLDVRLNGPEIGTPPVFMTV